MPRNRTQTQQNFFEKIMSNKHNNYIIFDEYKTNRPGAWYFVPDEGVFVKGVPCHGFGAVKYVEGSVYVGELYYDGEKFNKIGNGQQDFCRSTLGRKSIHSGLRHSKYVGAFDYRKTDWIYGNGVMYFVDENGEPQYFIKGFFSGFDKIGEWQGEFDYATLLNNYTRDMELAAEPGDFAADWVRECVAPWRDKHADVLFVGDSYFELGNVADYAGVNLFGKVFPQGYVNIGVGGSKFSDWLNWIDGASGMASPKKIVLNLGFNDIHSNMEPATVYKNYTEMVEKLRQYFGSPEIYLVQVVHSPKYAEMYKQECDFNNMTASTASTLGVKLIDWNDKIVASKQDCFHFDRLHPNEHGYALFEQAIKEAL